MEEPSPYERYLCAGLIRLHVLHHAAQEPIYGLELIKELARNGYRLSPGTIYPILHGLEERGLLAATEEQSERNRRRCYRATPEGRRALAAAKHRVHELFSEAVDDVRESRFHQGRVRSG